MSACITPVDTSAHCILGYVANAYADVMGFRVTRSPIIVTSGRQWRHNMDEVSS